MRAAEYRVALTLCAAWLCAAAAAAPALAAPPQGTGPTDWQTSIRERSAAQDFTGALGIADTRLREFPDDLDARGWRARILGWLGRWQEAEREYRAVLERAPRDVDVLVGLGRTLRALDRRAEARDAFRAALAIDPRNADASQALATVRNAPRHQLTVNADADELNYTPQDAQALTGSVRTDWNRRWISVALVRFDHRAGLGAARWSGAVTRKLTAQSALTVGASAGRDNGIVSKGEVFADFGRGFNFGRTGLVRGVELNISPRRLWFDAADVVTITPSALFYLPRDWTVSVALTAARSAFPNVGAEWRPSGITRVNFPIGTRVIGHAFVAAGTENFALVDQIGRFSARTIGGGARLHLADGRDLTAYVAYQARTQGRTQTSVGFGYAVRF
jgi:tetratricopeptide (TPR) repeat protein